MRNAMQTARMAAVAGGEVIASRGRDVGVVRTKGARTDMVTETDILAGVAAVKAITGISPKARFVVEEAEVYERAGVTEGTLRDDEVWVIDPLDGTTSFVHGFPCYSVSVALLQGGEPAAGAVYNVPSGELFCGAAGLGAFLEDSRMSCTGVSRLNEALMVTGFPYDRTTTLDRQLTALGRFMRAPIHGMRRDGSAAVDCCHVASGRADGFWEFGLRPWDTAAGVVILREAGAHVTGIDGAPWSVESAGIVAANPSLHARMLELLADV